MESSGWVRLPPAGDAREATLKAGARSLPPVSSPSNCLSDVNPTGAPHALGSPHGAQVRLAPRAPVGYQLVPGEPGAPSERGAPGAPVAESWRGLPGADLRWELRYWYDAVGLSSGVPLHRLVDKRDKAWASWHALLWPGLHAPGVFVRACSNLGRPALASGAGFMNYGGLAGPPARPARPASLGRSTSWRGSRGRCRAGGHRDHVPTAGGLPLGGGGTPAACS